MDQLTILTWAIAGGFSGTWAMMYFMIKSMVFQLERVEHKMHSIEKNVNEKIDKLDDKLSGRIDKLTEVVTDIDRRVCRIEGAIANKDCCMIKNDSQIKKVE